MRGGAAGSVGRSNAGVDLQLLRKPAVKCDPSLFRGGKRLASLPQERSHVRELASGEEKVYENPPGRFCGFLDAAAF